jgi:hypothetical protein
VSAPLVMLTALPSLTWLLLYVVLSLLDRACPRLAVNIIYVHLRPVTVDSFASYCLFELGFEVLLQGLSLV